jgi:phytoene desaturase
MKRVTVIGAGYGGLSVAALLAKEGYQVTLVEKNEQAGGRAMMFHRDGFSFDMGPSWYLMPEIFENFFDLFGKQVKDYYTLQQLSPSYRIYFDEKDFVDIPSDLPGVYRLFDTFEEGGGEKLKKYLDDAAYKYKVAVEEFLYKEYKHLGDFFNKQLIFEGLKLDVFSSMSKYVGKYFTSDKARKILQYTLVFLGGSPSNTPAIYSLMSHVDLTLGVWYPTGGMNAVARGLEQLGKQQGVEFRYNAPVAAISETVDGMNVELEDGEVIKSDLVISNADYHHTEMHLLAQRDRSYSENYWKRRVVAPSGFILYLGVNKKLPSLKHHTLFFENNWEEHFEQIFKDPQWPESPSYYICNPSKTDSGVAPAGKENLFVLVPVAAGLQDSNDFREEYAQRILKHIEEVIGEKFIDDIEVQRIFSHRDFSQLYNAFKGTALGLSHTLSQTALFRPAMHSKKLDNLFYVGQYTHPGVGVPMALISAQIVAQKIINTYGSN